MRNPFLRPATVSQWLRSSLCWTGACLGGALLGWLVLPRVLPGDLGALVATGVMPLSIVVAHILIWQRAVSGGRAIIRYDEEHHDFSLTRVAANLWLVALTVFQLACLLVPILLLGLLLFGGEPAPPAPPSKEPFFG